MLFSLRSVKLRLALLSSVLLFLVAGAMLAVTYVAVSRSLQGEPVTREVLRASRVGPFIVVERAQEVDLLATFENEVNQRTLDNLRRFSIFAGVALFPISVLVGWLVADRILRPVDRITSVARAIEASSDLGRRIDLHGPDDELKRLADTFDSMLARLDEGAQRQREFIQNTSHELRNPLAVAATNLDVALRDPDADAETLRHRAEVARRTVDRLSRLVDDLVAYGRQQGSEERQPVDVGDLARDVVDEFGPAAAERSLALSASATEGDLVLTIDRDAVRRAVANLVDNAVRLAPPGSAVRVEAGHRDEWVRLAVVDQGPGIAEDEQVQVFRRFWRASEGGTGLGLAIVRQVAESHGGTVTLRSASGQGSTFTIWLPTGPGAGPLPEEA